MPICVPSILYNSYNGGPAPVVCHFVCLVDGGGGGIFPEVYGLADGGVAVLLKSGLHFDVPFGLYIVSAFEDFTYVWRDFFDVLDAAGFDNLLFKFFAVKAGLCGDLFEDGINLEHFFLSQYLTMKDQ